MDSDGVGVRIGTDNVEAGRMAGRAALQTDWDSLTVGIVNFDLSSRNGQERESGFREALAGDPRVKDIYTINVNADATTAQVRTVQLLVEHPEINVIGRLQRADRRRRGHGRALPWPRGPRAHGRL